MERRKLQKTGRSTLIVSLPRKWAEENELGKGDYVFLYPRGSSLIVKAQREKETRYCELLFSDAEKTFRELVAKYVQGFEKIKITSRRGEWKKVKLVKEHALRKLAGIEVTDLPDGLLIEVVFAPKAGEIEGILERMKNAVEWVIAALKQAVREGDRELFREIIKKDDEIDRLNILAARKIFEVLETAQNPERLVYLKILLDKIESVADSFQAIARAFEKCEKNFDGIIPLFDELEKILSDIFSAHARNDKNLANRVIEKSLKFSKEKLSGLRSREDFSETHTIVLENLSRIAQLCKEAGECIIDFAG